MKREGVLKHPACETRTVRDEDALGDGEFSGQLGAVASAVFQRHVNVFRSGASDFKDRVHAVAAWRLHIHFEMVQLGRRVDLKDVRLVTCGEI